jgi:hypothetical protein
LKLLKPCCQCLKMIIKRVKGRLNKIFIFTKHYLETLLKFRSFKVTNLIIKTDRCLLGQDFNFHKLACEELIFQCSCKVLREDSCRFEIYLNKFKLHDYLDSIIASDGKLHFKLCALKYASQYTVLYSSFKQAEYTRSQWLKFLWRECENSKKFQIESLKAGLELGFLNDVKARIELLENYKLNNASFLNKIYRFCDLGARNTVMNNATSYSSLLCDRNIAIIGPAVDFSPDDHLKGIDKPIVVMTNYLSGIKCDNSLAPDISYYNSRKVLGNKKEIVGTLRFLKYCCFKSRADISSLKFSKGFAKLRVLEGVGDMMINDTGPNAIQNVIYDLWLNGVNMGISLHGVSLFLGKEAYKSGYWPDASNPSISQAIRWHEPFSNFSILKHYYNQHLISPSDDLDWIFNLSVTEYAENLDKTYTNAIK